MAIQVVVGMRRRGRDLGQYSVSSPDRQPVLAIGVDAADPTLVRRLIDEGELPALRDLLRRGVWRGVSSPTQIDPAAVWPTFVTGTDQGEHGSYGDRPWQPKSMGIASFGGRSFIPFWKGLAEHGVKVGVLDVPNARPLGLSRGFEVCDWGQHHGFVVGHPHASPAAIREVIGAARHPYSPRQPDPAGPQDHRGLRRLSSACVSGARLRGEIAARLIGEVRPDLAIIVFEEAHVAAHRLWHTTSENSALPASILTDIYREVDRQVARLVELAGSEAAVLVFSLHGMQHTRGIPTILDAWLRDQGFAHPLQWSGQSWAERAVETLAAVKRHTPTRVKRLYHRLMSPSVAGRIANTTALLPHDWSRTRAFSLPTAQHGLVRLNVAGREAEGIVAPERYDETCGLLEQLLRALSTPDGRPLVRSVLRVARDVGQALPERLPDLVVHWDDAACDSPARVSGTSIEAYPADTQLTGNHAPGGFCIMQGRFGDGLGDTVAAKDLHRMIGAALVLNQMTPTTSHARV